MIREKQEEGHGWSAIQFRVRYPECDQMGVVYHANYLNWFEIGRTEMIRESGFTYRSMEEQGLLLPVIDVSLKYHKPAKYDDLVTVYTQLTELSRMRLSFAYEIRCVAVDQQEMSRIQGDLLVTGATHHVWLNRDWKPARLDKALPEVYQSLQSLVADRKE
ncbi:acyl-CoA thioesterase [Paenibacillus sp. P96]|uniref:Acyl-CoA thioesterase n=1 Tax=Paenibacillus zeirhizosphaerae TaxID=2987519 RepID=A0ABT9FT15_9BACL|nr:thioesterase family protein [Paenibacillus sp. P96]MDP4097879.1 acyl-CoA thioesterase [Paenibacillus sp. P96]